MTNRVAGDNIVCQDVIIMIRTQISLSEVEYEAAKKEAGRLGISLAELLRRSLRTLRKVTVGSFVDTIRTVRCSFSP